MSRGLAASKLMNMFEQQAKAALNAAVWVRICLCYVILSVKKKNKKKHEGFYSKNSIKK